MFFYLSKLQVESNLTGTKRLSLVVLGTFEDSLISGKIIKHLKRQNCLFVRFFLYPVSIQIKQIVCLFRMQITRVLLAEEM